MYCTNSGNVDEYPLFLSPCVRRNETVPFVIEPGVKYATKPDCTHTFVYM